MATYPSDGGSDGTWGAECRAYHLVSTDLPTGKIKDGAVQVSSAPPTEDAAVANKLYVDNGGERGLSTDDGVSYTPTVVHTKYIKGTLDGTSTDSIPHGIADLDKILNVTLILDAGGAGTYTASDYRASSTATNSRFNFDATNIVITYGGSFVSASTKYRIKIEYID